MKELSHLDDRGRARMVDVSEKDPTSREAVAVGKILLGPRASKAVESCDVPKGDVFAAARIGAISAVKRTWETIPLCHNVSIGSVEVCFAMCGQEIETRCRVSGLERTGFEMEALCGVSAALLIIYDMTKSIEREMEITGVRLLSKTGGKSGEYIWQE